MRLSEKKLQELKEKKISIENLYEKYLYTEKDGVNVETILKLLNENICSFEELVDKFKNISEIGSLRDNTELFKKLIQNSLLNKDDLKYLLNTIDNVGELWSLCTNTPLIKHILNEFVLNKEDVDKFSILIENDDRYRIRNIHTIFELIEYFHKNNEEVLNLIELNEKVYLLNSFDLNRNQKLELIEVLRNNEIARNRMIQIVDSNLESNYSFDSLMDCLKKTEKKTILNI